MIIEKIKRIREAMHSNRLVIFVGSGVSANSNLPTWDSLIRKFADKIGYSKCASCSVKKDKCPFDDCNLRYNFSSDEFLKIPQYVYNKSEKEYYALIDDTINISVQSNIIDDIIVDMKPNHIITTNYDRLLERSNSISASQYLCVCGDRDLLTKKGEHYIIKMHGDIDDIENIVLREDDYLHYENKHMLIQTFIKALLVDHTFLFVGYSLNDYNLKLILSWIDFLSKKESAFTERTDNFLLLYKDGEIEEYERLYWENKKIQVLNAYEIPPQVLNDNHRDELNEIGNAIYSSLKCIADENNDYLFGTLTDVLIERYSIFDGYNRIAFSDISSVYRWNTTTHHEGRLHFYENEEYEKFRSIANNEIVAGYLIKAGIHFAYTFGNIGGYNYRRTDLVESEIVDNLEFTLFDLYLDNSYEKIFELLQKCDNIHVKAYYYYSILQYSEITEEIMREMSANYKNENIVKNLIFLYNKFLYRPRSFRGEYKYKEDSLRYIDMIPHKDRKAFGYITEIINNGVHRTDLIRAHDLLGEHETLYKNPYASSSDEYGKLYDIQMIAYQYYIFFKSNYIFLDHFHEPKKMLRSYIQAMLITYFNRKEVSEDHLMFGRMDSYIFNSIDLDMLIKYCDYKMLVKYISDNKIKDLRFHEKVNISEVFCNFCNSLIYCSENNAFHQVEKFKNFSLIIRYTDINLINREKIIEGLLLLSKCSKYGLMLKRTNDVLDEYCKLFRDVHDKGNRNCSIIMINLISSINWKELTSQNQNSLKHLFKNIEHDIDEATVQDEIFRVADKYDASLIVAAVFTTTWYITNAKSRDMIKKWFYDNLDALSYVTVFECLTQQMVNYDEKYLKPFIRTIENNIAEQETARGHHSYPNHLLHAINSGIILCLIGIVPSMDFLEPYVQYSEYLQFIFSPENFDYSKVNINDYMWTNLLLDPKYRGILLDNCKSKLTEDISKLIESGTPNRNLNKLYYCYICSDNDI